MINSQYKHYPTITLYNTRTGETVTKAGVVTVEKNSNNEYYCNYRQRDDIKTSTSFHPEWIILRVGLTSEGGGLE